MAYRPNPNDPFITPPPGDHVSRDPFADDVPVSGIRVALYAVAVLASVGALFYGMNTATREPVAPAAKSAAPAPAVTNSRMFEIAGDSLIIVVPRNDPAYDELRKRFGPPKQ
jgi:hypothetical protein